MAAGAKGASRQRSGGVDWSLARCSSCRMDDKVYSSPYSCNIVYVILIIIYFRCTFINIIQISGCISVK